MRFLTKRNLVLVALMILIAVPVLASTRLMRITDDTYLITHQKQSGFGGQGKALRMAYEKAASLCVNLDFKWFEILDTQSKGRGFGSAAASTMKVKFFKEKPDGEEREILSCKDLASKEQKVKMAKALAKMKARQ